MLRTLKNEGADDSQYLHELTYNDLADKPFREITPPEHRRLRAIESGLSLLVEERAVSKGVMKSALTDDEHSAYLKSYDTDISHAESEEFDVNEMPSMLNEYAAYLQMGDKYTRIANLHRNSKKRDAYGNTAFVRNTRKAERYYEQAVALITTEVDVKSPINWTSNAALNSQVHRWLDRDVSADYAYQPDATATGVPRIVSIKSRYCLVKPTPVSGVRMRKYWRQREALVKASLNLLYDEQSVKLSAGQSPEEIIEQTAVCRQLAERFRRVQQLVSSFPHSQ